MRVKFRDVLYTLSVILASNLAAADQKRLNVLFIILDDLTAPALSCYENKV